MRANCIHIRLFDIITYCGSAQQQQDQQIGQQQHASMRLEGQIGVVIRAVIAIAKSHLNQHKNTLNRLTPQG